MSLLIPIVIILVALIVIVLVAAPRLALVDQDAEARAEERQGYNEGDVQVAAEEHKEEAGAERQAMAPDGHGREVEPVAH